MRPVLVVAALFAAVFTVSCGSDDVQPAVPGSESTTVSASSDEDATDTTLPPEYEGDSAEESTAAETVETLPTDLYDEATGTLPEDFPSSIPIPDSWDVEEGYKTPGGNMTVFTVSFFTDDPFADAGAEAGAMFESEGWSPLNSTSDPLATGFYSRTFQKDNVAVQAGCGTAQEGPTRCTYLVNVK